MSPLRILILGLALCLGVPAAADAAEPKRRYYVSLGDSYATGSQPSVVRQSAGTRNGFAYTYYCKYRDIHARTGGYRLIAELVVKTLPKR